MVWGPRPRVCVCVCARAPRARRPLFCRATAGLCVYPFLRQNRAGGVGREGRLPGGAGRGRVDGTRAGARPRVYAPRPRPPPPRPAEPRERAAGRCARWSCDVGAPEGRAGAAPEVRCRAADSGRKGPSQAGALVSRSARQEQAPRPCVCLAPGGGKFRGRRI